MYTDIQFKKDTELLTKFIYINAGIDHMVKKADMGDDITSFLKNIGGSIVDSVKQRYQEDGMAGVATYIITGLLPGRLKIISVLFDSLLGINIADVLNPVFKKVESIIKNKGSFEQSDADAILNENKTANISYLYSIEKEGNVVDFLKIIKEAKGNIWPSFGKNLNHREKNSLAGGLIKWLLKLVFAGLIGATALEGSKVLTKSIVESEPNNEDPSGFLNTETKKVNYNLPQKKQNNLNFSGWGDTYFLNTNSNLWMVPLSGTVENTLYQWILKVYPELKNKKDEIVNCNSFNIMASTLGKLYNSNHPSELQIIPDSGLHTIKDIVDHAISDLI